MKRRLLLVMSFGLLAACDEMVGPGPGTPGSNAAPTVDLTADVTEGNAPLAVNFTATASDPDGDTLEYTLNFGDGESVSAQSAAHTYQTAGSYVASVTVDDNQGGSANDSVTIEVAEDGSDDGGDGGDGGDDGGGGGSGGDDGDAEACTNPVEIPDEVLEKVIRNELSKQSGDLTCADMASLTELQYSPDSGGDGTLPTPPVTNLSGLEFATLLRELSLIENEITDVTPLRNLAELEVLDLSLNNIQTTKTIAEIANLKNLNLFRSGISSIAPLAKLTKLEVLAIGGNPFSDLSPLQSLVKLEQLNISFSEVSDLTPLSGLTQLLLLSASSNDFTTLDGLQSLTNLRELILDRNTLSDISQLQSLINVEQLDLVQSGISDISSLQPLNRLTSLAVGDNNINDITPLINNAGVGAGDYVDLYSNDLDTCPGSSDLADIQALEARGANVNYDACEQ